MNNFFLGLFISLYPAFCSGNQNDVDSIFPPICPQHNNQEREVGMRYRDGPKLFRELPWLKVSQNLGLPGPTP